MKKGIALFLAAAMCMLLLAGCGTSSASSSQTAAASAASSSAASGGETVITIANEADPGTLAPWGPRGVRNYFINQVYQPIGKWDMNKKWVNILAESIDEQGNGVYVVKLHDNIVDSAGNAVKASDVVFSYGKFKEEGSNASYVSSLGSVEAVDDLTVKFTMQNEKIGAFYSMADEVRIVSEKSYNDSSDKMVTTPVGTSPYVLQEYVTGSHATFVRNDNYWNKDAADKSQYDLSNVDKIVVSVITDASTLAIAMQKGEIDFTQNMGAADIGTFVNDDGSAKEGYTAFYSTQAVTNHLIFNCSDASECSDINLRRAIAYSIDAAAIAQSMWGFRGHEALTLNNPNYLDFDSANKGYFTYDEAKAKDYLAQSKYDGKTLRILVDSNSVVRQAAVLIQAYLQAIGIKADLLEYEDAVYQSYRVGDGTVDGAAYDMEFSCPASNMYTWNMMFEFDANNYNNKLPRTYVADDKLQQLFDASAEAATANVENTDALMAYICSDQCYARPVYYYDKCALYNARVTTIVTDKTGSIIPGACKVA